MNQRYLGLALIMNLSLVVGTLGSATPGQASTVNHEIWAKLLGKYVKPGGVDYAGFKKEEERLDQYLKMLKTRIRKSYPAENSMPTTLMHTMPGR